MVGLPELIIVFRIEYSNLINDLIAGSFHLRMYIFSVIVVSFVRLLRKNRKEKMLKYFQYAGPDPFSAIA